MLHYLIKSEDTQIVKLRQNFQFYFSFLISGMMVVKTDID